MNPVMTTGQVAKVCKVASRTVTGWFDRGLLKGFRLPRGRDTKGHPGDRRVFRDDLIQFMRENDMERLIPKNWTPVVFAVDVSITHEEALRNYEPDVKIMAFTSLESLAMLSKYCPIGVVIGSHVPVEIARAIIACQKSLKLRFLSAILLSDDSGLTTEEALGRGPFDVAIPANPYAIIERMPSFITEARKLTVET